MKVIILKTDNKIGRAGEIKEVSDGHARNFLIPRGLAKPATVGAVEAMSAARQRSESKAIKQAESKRKLAGKLKGKVFSVKAKADLGGTLYAGLDAKDIAAALWKKGARVDASEIALAGKIKKNGEYAIEANLGGQKACFKLIVN